MAVSMGAWSRACECAGVGARSCECVVVGVGVGSSVRVRGDCNVQKRRFSIMDVYIWSIACL